MKKSVVARGVVAVCLLLCGIMACETNTATTAEETAIYPSSGTHTGHAYVDMGLSVKWATCNVGADSPSDEGNNYAWGETETKSIFVSYNCDTNDKQIGDIGGTSRDVAHVKWGGGWRMPTEAEFEELLDADNCTWTWATLDGHEGYKVKSKKTGNWIFLPAATLRDGTSLGTGFYWSSTSIETNTLYAVRLYFRSSGRYTYWDYRHHGMTVRPVGEF